MTTRAFLRVDMKFFLPRTTLPIAGGPDNPAPRAGRLLARDEARSRERAGGGQVRSLIDPGWPDMVTAPMPAHKILLVDDNHELLRLLGRLVEGEGWKPVTCARGKAALDAIGTEKPAVGVVDILLPDMMGYDVGAALKKAGI